MTPTKKDYKCWTQVHLATPLPPTDNSPSHSSRLYIKYTYKVKVEENTALQESSTLQIAYPSWPNISIEILLLNYVACRNGNIEYCHARAYRLIQICPPGRCKTQTTILRTKMCNATFYTIRPAVSIVLVNTPFLCILSNCQMLRHS